MCVCVGAFKVGVIVSVINVGEVVSFVFQIGEGFGLISD